MTTTHEKLREALAAYAHEAWSGWMQYMFSKCKDCDNDLFIPGHLVERWTRQINTPYADLPEHEKDSDRDEADKILALFFDSRDEVRALAEAQAAFRLEMGKIKLAVKDDLILSYGKPKPSDWRPEED